MNAPKLIATWFGAGLSPFAPGTAGSLAALPFAYVIQTTFGNAALVAFAATVFLLGCWATKSYLATTGKQDPGEVVIDEVAGQCLLLAALFPTWQSYLAGFFLFRLFDVVKPWPVSYFDQHVKGAFGVMLDDIAAALYPVLFLLIFSGMEWMQPVMQWLGGQL